MARVTGPLFSIEARGKIADAMVHFPWKGKCVVREWKVPANPQTGAQGDVRLILGGLGRACSAIVKTSQYAEYARAVTPTGQTWVSKFVQYMRATYMSTSAAYELENLEARSHAVAADFDNEAADIGLVEFDITYKVTATTFNKITQLYELAKFSTAQYILDNTKFNATPYTKALGTWVLVDIQEMVADFVAI